MGRKVLAVGADGKFAGLVVPALAEHGAEVRGLVRDPRASAGVLARGATEIAIGDLRDRAAIDRALEGVTAVFYIAPAFLEDEGEVGKSLVTAAVAAGVRRFVFSSVIHPVLSGLPNHAQKAVVEEAVLDSNLEYVFLHPALFFQNYEAGWERVLKTGVLAEPWSNDTRFSRVDYRDVAEVAAIAVMEERLVDGTFELCADGALDRREVAALISAVLRRQVTPKRVEPNTLGPETVPMHPMFAHYDRVGLRGSAVTLTAILGRAPRTLLAYFNELSTNTPAR